ncbi:MAG: DUF5672 family protein [Luteolibacter sp.]
MILKFVQRWAAKRAANIKPPSMRVAVMVPLPTPVLAADEKVSMRQLREHLDLYDKFLLVPRGMKTELGGFRVIELDRRHFGSAANHNRMLYLPEFWELFSDYEYVLMYHLDALVFSDQLADWCDKGYDFIGAPFLSCPDSPWVKKERVGNGGFALYRVPSVLMVLWNRYRLRPTKYFEDHFWKWIHWQRIILKPFRAASPQWLRGECTEPLRNALRRMDHIEANELGNDSFWADRAINYLPEFKVAPLQDGLRFAFEVAPRLCLERNAGKMPFGCHAWARYDKAFWIENLAGITILTVEG